jgi:hypothetical protein
MSKLALRCLPPASTAGQSRVANPSTSSGTTTLRSWAGSRTDDTRRQARSLLVRQQRTTPQVSHAQLAVPSTCGLTLGMRLARRLRDLRCRARCRPTSSGRRSPRSVRKAPTDRQSVSPTPLADDDQALRLWLAAVDRTSSLPRSARLGRVERERSPSAGPGRFLASSRQRSRPSRRQARIRPGSTVLAVSVSYRPPTRLPARALLQLTSCVPSEKPSGFSQLSLDPLNLLQRPRVLTDV